MMKRCAISFFYDQDGVMDDYMVFLLSKTAQYAKQIVLVVNGHLDKESISKIRPFVNTIIYRENAGFDVWAYKAGLEHIGYKELANYDEVLLFNHTFYGPIFPFSELFMEMEARDCDFWGITAHKEVAATPENSTEPVPFHLNSHYIAIRKSILKSKYFEEYWKNIPPIKSYNDSIQLHELCFTKYLTDHGFRVDSYIDSSSFGSAYAAFFEVDVTIEKRCPILKRRLFFHDPTFLEANAVDLPRALRLLGEKSDYDQSLIWQNIVRATNARTLYTNASLLKVLPDSRLKSSSSQTNNGKIAVCAHAHYVELVDELLDYALHIPCEFDFIVTTNTEAKKKEIERIAHARVKNGKVIVRVVEQMRGRDMAALFLTCRDLFADDHYDLVCRVHTKRSPHVDSQRGSFFKRFMLENVLNSRGYVENILDMFAANSRLGVVMPPMFHISYPTFGHAWFVNKGRAESVADKLGIQAPLDEYAPIATYGGMFWFRPKAIRKLFSDWQYRDFEGEPHPPDGALAHALERLIVYAAQDSGYIAESVLTLQHAAQSHVMLEFKMNALTSLMPTGDFKSQVELLNKSRYFLGAVFTGSLNPSQLNPTNLVARISNLESQLRERKQRLSHVQAKMIEFLNAEMNEPFVPWTKALSNKVIKGSRIGFQIRREAKTINAYFHKLGKYSNSVAQRVPDKRDIFKYIISGYLEGDDLFYLFDSRFYLANNPDIADAGVNPLAHFITNGWREGRSPHPLFDMGFYRERYPDFARPNDLPFLAYLSSGARSGHSPHPLFDAKAYMKMCPESAEGRFNPLLHYLEVGAKCGLNPHPLFDTKFYVSHSPEILDFGINPLVHFVRYGAQEGRKPHPDFDSVYYLQENCDVLASGGNPLIHYVLHGRYEGRRPVAKTSHA